jgi:hypothetical protein
MPRTLAVILAVLALGGAVFFFSLDPREDDGGAITPLTKPKEQALVAAPDGERLLVEAPPAGATVVDAAMAAEIDDDAAQGPLGFSPYEAPFKTPRDAFEAMYGGMTLAELAAHKGMVEVEYFDALQKVVDARFAAGLYAEYVVEPGEDPEVGPDLPPWPEHKGLIKSQRTEDLDDGRLQVRRTVIPYAENPDLYASWDELSWLIVRISKLKSGH